MGHHDLENEDYEWLLDALGGPGLGDPYDVLARPSAAHPQFLVPLDHRAASVGALRRYHDGHTRRERLKASAGISFARWGLLGFAPGDRINVGPFAMVEQLGDLLEEPNLQVAVTLGPRRRNRKPVLQLLRPDGSTVGFAKVGWSRFTASLVDNEARWLERLDSRLPDVIQIPRVITRIDHGERLVVVTSPLATVPPSTGKPRLAPPAIIELARALGTTRVPFAGLPHLDTFRSNRVGQLIDLDRLVDVHRDTTIELGLWHGDLTPWNTSTAGGISRVWDWEFADCDRPVGFDLLHSAFELVRRQRARNEVAALAAVRDQADSICSSIEQPTDAVLDLYLCELIAREARLGGEGWDPSDLGPLETHAVDLLKHRLT
jgi:hypothetical protein